MSLAIHHVIVLVHDMERSILLFEGIIGLQLIWRIPEIGGAKMSSVLGIENIKAEIAYLSGGSRNTAVELVRLKQGDSETNENTVGSSGTGLSFVVRDLDRIYGQLKDMGWSPFTDPIDMMSPEGKPVRMFCFRTEEQLLIEIVQENP